ncbi:MAG: glycoside hydrolase, partial [Clostridia bacterium]|nr:glycoside hydrolase [Clostridia bacterium]
MDTSNEGVNVMAFDDIYPEGHQSGVSVLMHGRRIATCGDVRFEPTPGQWQPVPGQVSRKLDAQRNAIITRLRFPDEKKSLRGTNPMVYPDLELSYQVTVRGEGDAAVIEVDLDEPVPEAFAGR